MRKRKKKLPDLPTDFTHIKALPLPLFALAGGEHEETTRRRIKAEGSDLEVIKVSPKKTLVVLTDEHRRVFQALADLRKAQPQLSTNDLAVAPDDEPRRAAPRPPRPEELR
jgi:hypothetical protein